MLDQKAAVIVVGPVGSRLAGISHNARTLIQRLGDQCVVSVGETGPATEKTRPAAYHLSRLTRNLRATLSVLRHGLRERQPCACIFVDGGLGQYYTILHVAAARLTGHRIVLRHHTFDYVDTTRRTFGFIAWLAGPRALHTMLCQAMDRKLRARYSSVHRSIVLSNASLSPPRQPGSEDASRTEVLGIGFLSNLTREKGLFEVLELARRCFEDGLAVRFVLAGPIDRTEERVAVDAAIADMPEMLSYIGPVYGEQKTAFFDSIGAFVFPTRYRMEAQPNVLFEAMACGITVLSYDRACIGEDVRENAGFVYDLDSDFVEQALARLRTLTSRSRQEAEADRRSVVRFYEKSYEKSVDRYRHMIRFMIDPSVDPTEYLGA
jgi:glycosyltransferase involved in cell wall biosynthesis